MCQFSTTCTSPDSGSCFPYDLYVKGSPTSATGDPHLTNMLGERFDLLKRGTHVFIQIPRGADAEHTLLRVEANVTGGKLCNYAFIRELKITGK